MQITERTPGQAVQDVVTIANINAARKMSSRRPSVKSPDFWDQVEAQTPVVAIVDCPNPAFPSFIAKHDKRTEAKKAAFVEAKPVDLSDFDANQIPDTCDLEAAECAYQMLTTNMDAWMSLSESLRLTEGRNLAISPFWHRAKMTVGIKQVVSHVSMLWKQDPDNPFRVAYKSLTRRNKYHHCEYLPDAPEGEQLTCDCEAATECSDKSCHHLRDFAKHHVPQMIGVSFTESASTETESIHRQDRDAESNEYNRERIDKDGARLRNVKGDF